ncbi:MAG: hypothetical protein HC835_00030 [Oscillatoriales cyanobacterium RM2_1_1]|nr:hypothetical protein [Oscillatoriales cyanobacterium SM2_3_0]NJO44142.1 hypothetical protein [Oscillatoriales cyanobacterium RM2_1_1]
MNLSNLTLNLSNLTLNLSNLTLKRLTVIGLTLALILALPQGAWADREKLSAGTPLSISGTSGGTTNSGDCGYIATTPNHVIDVTEDLTFWQIRVKTAGSPTLLIDGPGGRYCVLPEGGLLQFSGYGTPGTYKLFIGDRAQGKHPYTLSVSGRQ